MRHPGLLLLGAGLTVTAQAEMLRCANSVIDEGQSTQVLIGRCGPPTDVTDVPAVVNTETEIDGYTGRRYTVQQVVRPAYQVWYYNFGPTRLAASITVMNGLVVKIQKGGYGN